MVGIRHNHRQTVIDPRRTAPINEKATYCRRKRAQSDFDVTRAVGRVRQPSLGRLSVPAAVGPFAQPRLKSQSPFITPRRPALLLRPMPLPPTYPEPALSAAFFLSFRLRYPLQAHFEFASHIVAIWKHSSPCLEKLLSPPPSHLTKVINESFTS